MKFFITKIQKIRDILEISELTQSTKEMTCSPNLSLLKPSAVGLTLETLTPATEEEIISIMKKSFKASCVAYSIKFHQTFCVSCYHTLLLLS